MKIEEILKLPSVKYKNKDELPLDSGVYLIMLGCLFLYVGKANSLRNRLLNHELNKILADKDMLSVYYKLVSNNKHRYEIENYLIFRYKPVYNKTCIIENTKIWIHDKDDMSVFPKTPKSGRFSTINIDVI